MSHRLIKNKKGERWVGDVAACRDIHVTISMPKLKALCSQHSRTPETISTAIKAIVIKRNPTHSRDPMLHDSSHDSIFSTFQYI